MVSQKTYTQSSERLLAELAGLYGVSPGYRDSRGMPRESPRRSIYQALASLGADVDPVAADCRGSGAASEAGRLEKAIRSRKAAALARLIDPVVVYWEGLPGPLRLTLPRGAQVRVDCRLTLEDGSNLEWRLGPESLVDAGQHRIGGRDYAEYRLRGIPRSREARWERLPPGYHRLRVLGGRYEAEATLISAPRRCWSPGCANGQSWGVFAPLYGLRSGRDWGAGDLAELELLSGWVGEAGGDAVATLPLLAAYLEQPFEPAPYRPVSRLFWNEFYLAVERTAEWVECAGARALWEARSIQDEIAALRAGAFVDYAAVMTIKRRVLEELSRCFFECAGSGRKQALADYLAAHPHAGAYAAFRARSEATGSDWTHWPGSPPAGRQAVEARGGRAPVDVGELSEPERYHLYCQWQMDEQLGRLSGTSSPPSARSRPGLFLDVPVGVHPGGFDTWRWSDLFVRQMSVGSPPDAFFALGQSWQTPPLHPDHMREHGHQYFASYLRDQMRHAHYLRIDHFMGLHRLFWVPEGGEPRDGVYVSYPAEEQYAVLSLESHRNHAVVVGEDLGTVPPGVRSSMRRHGVLGTWVLQLSLRSRARNLVPQPPRHDIAAVNTHDTFPFAGFLRGDDIETRVETGQLDRHGARRETAARRRLIARLDAELPCTAERAETGLLLRAVHHIVQSRPALVLVNLEDLWGETRPQNLPGTGSEQRNWQRKLAAGEADIRRGLRRVAGVIRGGQPPATSRTLRCRAQGAPPER